MMPVMPEATRYYTPRVITISVIGIIYTAITTRRQIDMKKIIAYASVGHMGYVTRGMYTGNIEGREGIVMLMLSHG